MLFRLVDVAAEYVKPLLLALVVVPLAAGAAFVLTNQTSVITTVIWADRPTAVFDSRGQAIDPNTNPGRTQASLLQELVASSRFLDVVLGRADPGYLAIDSNAQGSRRAQLRKSLRVTADGHVVRLELTWADERGGLAILRAMTASLGDAIGALESPASGIGVFTEGTGGNPAASGSSPALDAATSEMNASLAAIRQYASAHPASPDERSQDPEYQMLIAQATSRINYYLSLLDQSDRATDGAVASPASTRAAFHVVDAPSAAFEPLGPVSGLLRVAGAALAGIAVLTLVFVYLVARRETRVRAPQDVEVSLGVSAMCSMPLIRAHR